MPEHSKTKTKAKKPKNYAKLSQKQKFIEAAKQAEVDESGETFDSALKHLVKKRATELRPARQNRTDSAKQKH